MIDGQDSTTHDHDVWHERRSETEPEEVALLYHYMASPVHFVPAEPPSRRRSQGVQRRRLVDPPSTSERPRFQRRARVWNV